MTLADGRIWAWTEDGWEPTGQIDEHVIRFQCPCPAVDEPGHPVPT